MSLDIPVGALHQLSNARAREATFSLCEPTSHQSTVLSVLFEDPGGKLHCASTPLRSMASQPIVPRFD